jgi:hypothetical protein
MPGCDQITIGSLYDCADPPVGGMRPRVILFNKDDLGSPTVNATDIITALAVNSGAVGYLFEGFKQSVKVIEEAVQPASGQTMYRHKIEYTVFNVSQAQKNNLQRKALGRFVALVQNSKVGPDSFRVVGLNSGLVMLAQQIRSSAENGDTYKITLQSGEGEEEPKLAQTFFVTDYATTLSTINGYLKQPTITSLNVSSVNLSTGTAVTITGTNFFGGVGVNQVLSVTWINQVTGVRINEPTLTVADTTISFTSRTTAQNAQFVAGSYKVEVLTTRGVIVSTAIIAAA